MEVRSQTQRCTRGRDAASAWCPWCYENFRGRAAHKGHAHYYPLVIHHATYEDFKVKRPSQATRPKKGEFVCPDTAFFHAYPELAKGMCDPWWDDGKERKRWTLKIAFTEDAILLTLNDPDSKLVCFTSAAGLSAGLSALEDALGGEGLSWRKSKY
jgi:hypothetical protein